jgi:hypothetical protein
MLYFRESSVNSDTKLPMLFLVILLPLLFWVYKVNMVFPPLIRNYRLYFYPNKPCFLYNS